MFRNLRNIMLVCTMTLLLFAISAICLFGKKEDFSESERRMLAKTPILSAETLLSGEWMQDFETYAVDHFPMRNSFRTWKAFTSLHLLQQLDTNGLYQQDGYLAKMEYPIVPKMQKHALERFQFLYDTYLADGSRNVYLSIIPDKHYFLAQNSVRLSLDYSGFVDSICAKTPYMQYVDLFPLLSIEDYYFTDTHWRQECLIKVAETLAAAMQTEVDSEYTIHTLENPFYGVYSGQLALPVKPDTICYLTNDILDACVVTSYDTGVPVRKSMYDMEKAYGKDPYELFLSGAQAVMTIENPNAVQQRELLVFRDSFGSSLIPLLVKGYSNITLVDIRYVRSDILETIVELNQQDVLFLYSTSILNNSLALK